jgi:hypothetical protein
MKKILAFLILSMALVSCYEDYVKDFDYTAIYFPNTIDVRTVVVGEGLKVKIGAQLGGVMENKFDRNVNFTLNNSLVTPAVLALMKGSTYAYLKAAVANVTALSPLPASYYTLSNTSNIVITAGQHSGTVTLKVDSAIFLADSKTLDANYVIPFYINTADADTIIESKRSLVVGIKYENMLFGNYLHGGKTIVKDATGAPIDTIEYYTSRTQVDTKIWKLTTIAPNTVATNGYSDKTSTTKKELTLTLNGTGITLGSATGSTNTYLPNGENTYNGAKLLQNRKILLNYKYVSGENTYECTDTLTFRNRIRDGINEWQDENPSNYLK